MILRKRKQIIKKSEDDNVEGRRQDRRGMNA